MKEERRFFFCRINGVWLPGVAVVVATSVEKAVELVRALCISEKLGDPGNTGSATTSCRAQLNAESMAF